MTGLEIKLNQILAEKTNKVLPNKFMNNWQVFNIARSEKV